MTAEVAIKYLEGEKEKINNKGVTYETRTEAIDFGISAIKKLGYLTDRPCEVCKFRKENGCSKWNCVF